MRSFSVCIEKRNFQIAYIAQVHDIFVSLNAYGVKLDNCDVISSLPCLAWETGNTTSVTPEQCRE